MDAHTEAHTEAIAAAHTEVIAAKLHEIAAANLVHQRELLQHQISTRWDLVDFIERQQAPVSSITCPLCDHHAAADTFKTYESHCIFEGGKLLRYQCANCDVIFGPQKMLDLSPSELSKDYTWHYKVFSEGDSTEAEMRAFFAMNPTKEGLYLNWGAGCWSQTIGLLRSEGWNVYGYEPHSSAAGQNQHIISSKEDLKKMRFNGIFSNNLLEHLRYPVAELAEMSSFLQDGGIMSHATPCFEYLYEYTR
ncbi:MAG: methyltransferase domain-containing protein, partial [Cyanobacteria bacterium J06560_2]